MTGANTVGVVGASGRAAAMSLARAGFSSWVVDLFADRDTRRIAPAARCPFEDYPQGLIKLCESFPPSPVIYTGGLENHPDVIRELSTNRPVWGNSADVVERARDPFRLYHALSAAGLPTPRVLPITSVTPAGRWVRKAHSSGGLGVRLARVCESSSDGAYLQEFIDGPVYSAQIRSENGLYDIRGITEQLIGEQWLNAATFRYAGNIGPVELSPQTNETLERIVIAAIEATGISGTWGIDFVLWKDEPYLLEINPRYTAALEVVEICTRYSAFSRTPLRAPVMFRGGKAIYFAPRTVTFPASGPWDEEFLGEFHPWREFAFADIPEPGEVIDSGMPVLTFFAWALSPAEVRSRLQSRAAELDQLFARQQP